METRGSRVFIARQKFLVPPFLTALAPVLPRLLSFESRKTDVCYSFTNLRLDAYNIVSIGRKIYHQTNNKTARLAQLVSA